MTTIVFRGVFSWRNYFLVTRIFGAVYAERINYVLLERIQAERYLDFHCSVCES